VYLSNRAGVHTINAHSRSAIGVGAQTDTATNNVGLTKMAIQCINHIDLSGQRGEAGGVDIDRSLPFTGYRGGQIDRGDLRGRRVVREKYVRRFTLPWGGGGGVPAVHLILIFVVRPWNTTGS